MKGKQVILLIPEIALTYQTVLRFCHRFGDRVSVLHSRLSMGERSDQFERAKKGEIQVMIGPRSALFTPFPNLGLIVIDEEHEDVLSERDSALLSCEGDGDRQGGTGTLSGAVRQRNSFGGCLLSGQSRGFTGCSRWKRDMKTGRWQRLQRWISGKN